MNALNNLYYKLGRLEMESTILDEIVSDRGLAYEQKKSQLGGFIQGIEYSIQKIEAEQRGEL